VVGGRAAPSPSAEELDEGREEELECLGLE